MENTIETKSFEFAVRVINFAFYTLHFAFKKG